MSTTTPVRRRLATRPTTGTVPIARPSLGNRLAGAVRRRAACAWRRLTAGNRRPSAEAALDWLIGDGTTDGVPAVAGAATGCPGATGGAIETVSACGAMDVARRWAGWLLSIQRPDGSLPDQSYRSASLPNTAQAVRGLLAIEPDMPEVRAAVVAACRYLQSRIDGVARGSLCPRPPAASHGANTHVACLPPLYRAARRYCEPRWEAAVRRSAARCFQAVDPGWRNVPTHVRAWWIEALIELGHYEAAAHAMQLPARGQRRDGSVPAFPGGRWVSSAALAHLAVCWYKLTRHDPTNQQRADRAMRLLARRQHRRGGFRGSWGPGAEYHKETEIAWTAKYYLDAALLQVQTAFDVWPTSVPELELGNRMGKVLPGQIDPADGRAEAVRGWAASLPPGARVADVGCGKGRFLRHLARWFPRARLTGIDVSPAMLAHLPAGVTALQGSLLRIPAGDGTFDAALAVESLEHALFPARAVAELCRVVRPGGRVLVVDKNRRRQPLSEHQPWERWFRPAELAGWLSAGCDEVTVEPISHLEGRGGSDLFLAAAGRRRW